MGTYYCGDYVDQGRAYAVYGLGYIYLAGSTGSNVGIAIQGAHQTRAKAYASTSFLAKLVDLNTSVIVSSSAAIVQAPTAVRRRWGAARRPRLPASYRHLHRHGRRPSVIRNWAGRHSCGARGESFESCSDQAYVALRFDGTPSSNIQPIALLSLRQVLPPSIRTRCIFTASSQTALHGTSASNQNEPRALPP